MSDPEGCLEKIVGFLFLGALMFLGSALCSGELNPVLEPASVQPGISLPEQGRLQWISWVFRVPGMVIALAVVPLLWLRVLLRQRFRVSSSDPPITQAAQRPACCSGFRAGSPGGNPTDIAHFVID